MEREIPAAEIDSRFEEICELADAGDIIFFTVDGKRDLVMIMMSIERYMDQFGTLLSDEDRAFLEGMHELPPSTPVDLCNEPSEE